MAHFTAPEVNAWFEGTKLSLSTLENDLSQHVANIILNRLSPVFNISGWTNDANTPKLVRTIISMYYAAAIYDRAYTDDANGSTANYAALLRSMADTNIMGLLSGAVILPEDPTANADEMTPIFFPNDASSANEASVEFPSDGGPAFMMGSVF